MLEGEEEGEGEEEEGGGTSASQRGVGIHRCRGDQKPVSGEL